MSRRKSLVMSAAGLLAAAALIAGCTSAPLTDPRKIVANAQTSLKNLNSVHFQLQAAGQFIIGVAAAPTPEPLPSTSPSAEASASADASSSAGASGSAAPSASPSATATPSPTAAPSPSPSAGPTPTPLYTALPISLDKTTAEGDVDFQNQTAHLSGGMPGLPGVSGELVIIHPWSYFRAYGQTKYTMTGDSELPVNPVLANGPLFVVQKMLDVAADPGLGAELVGTEDEPSGPCYHIHVNVTQSALNSQLASLSVVKALGSGTLDLWITQGDYQLERLDFTTSDPAAGTAAIRLVLSNWNRVQLITGPPANEFEAPGFSFGQ